MNPKTQYRVTTSSQIELYITPNKILAGFFFFFDLTNWSLYGSEGSRTVKAIFKGTRKLEDLQYLTSRLIKLQWSNNVILVLRLTNRSLEQKRVQEYKPTYVINRFLSKVERQFKKRTMVFIIGAGKTGFPNAKT